MIVALPAISSLTGCLGSPAVSAAAVCTSVIAVSGFALSLILKPRYASGPSGSDRPDPGAVKTVTCSVEDLASGPGSTSDCTTAPIARANPLGSSLTNERSAFGYVRRMVTDPISISAADASVSGATTGAPAWAALSPMLIVVTPAGCCGRWGRAATLTASVTESSRHGAGRKVIDARMMAGCLEGVNVRRMGSNGRTRMCLTPSAAPGSVRLKGAPGRVA